MSEVQSITQPAAPSLQSAKDTLRQLFFRGRCIKQYRTDGFTAAVEDLIADGTAVATEYGADGVRIVRGSHKPTD